jgi:hypothetical protein
VVESLAALMIATSGYPGKSWEGIHQNTLAAYDLTAQEQAWQKGSPQRNIIHHNGRSPSGGP